MPFVPAPAPRPVAPAPVKPAAPAYKAPSVTKPVAPKGSAYNAPTNTHTSSVVPVYVPFYGGSDDSADGVATSAVLVLFLAILVVSVVMIRREFRI